MGQTKDFSKVPTSFMVLMLLYGKSFQRCLFLFLLQNFSFLLIVQNYSGSSLLALFLNFVSSLFGCQCVAFIYAGLAREPKSTWQWHACEHKTIALLESDKELTWDNLINSKRITPLCGSYAFLAPRLLIWSCTLFLGLVLLFYQNLPDVLAAILLFFMPFSSILLAHLAALFVQRFYFTREPTEEQLKESLRVAAEIKEKLVLRQAQDNGEQSRTIEDTQ